MKLIDSFRRSAAQLRDLRSLTGASLLLALSISLSACGGGAAEPSPQLRIGGSPVF